MAPATETIKPVSGESTKETVKTIPHALFFFEGFGFTHSPGAIAPRKARARVWMNGNGCLKILD